MQNLKRKFISSIVDIFLKINDFIWSHYEDKKILVPKIIVNLGIYFFILEADTNKCQIEN